MQEIHHIVAEHSTQRTIEEVPSTVEPDLHKVSQTDSGGVKRMQTIDAIESREDVIRTLDQICAYYKRHEPSSPLPILINRAKRLVAKDFIDIIKNLMPDAVGQAEMLKGPMDEES